MTLLLSPFGPLSSLLLSQDWPQFRGPAGSGHSSIRNLPTRWGGLLTPPAWQTSIPGRGWSSPIVVGDRVWLTTAETTALREAETVAKLVESEADPRDFQTHGSVTFFAVEIDLANGAILRKIELFAVDQPPPIHATNSYASPTPASDGEKLYCHFGSLGTAAIALDSGELCWQRRLVVEDITGAGSSPIVDGHRLFLASDGADQQSVIALDKETGQTLWQTHRPTVDTDDAFKRRAFSTPILIQYLGRHQLIVPAAQWLVSYDPESGREWWRCQTAPGYSVIPQATFDDGLVFTCTGYMKPEVWAIRADGTGDVSQTHVAWKHTRQAPEIASPIAIDGRLYFVSTNGVLTCLATADGSVRWQHRLNGSYASSPIYADGKLYLTNRSGTTIAIQPGPSYVELARNELFGECLASLAVAPDALLLRTDPILFCLRNR